ncbi:serine/threonine-protein kinase [Methylogaea oryzae]|uniref:serine/threonine-protein kinase n=1 Tax=Methylogaea oryzae TaxID=1295382 RepID=UPI0006D298D6|nr:serine/threonine-protein kinase [Methylogaea oryzae]
MTLGKYQVVRELGRGASGIVYEGYDPVLERRVALKTIRKDLLQAGSRENVEHVLQRFRREALAAARLQHPNIVMAYDYAEAGDTVFIAMELVRGKELKSYFAQKHRFDLNTALGIMFQLLDGLAYSHRHNVVHRDIKPSNIILIDGSGQVKIADFGVARVDTSELTQAGDIMGTPTHMAPEQLLGRTVDGRADLFSAGVVLYELLTGELPFTGGNLTASCTIY